MSRTKTLLHRIGSYFRILKGVRLPWVLIVISMGFSIAEGTISLTVAQMTGEIIDGTQNAINGAKLASYIGITAFTAALAILTSYFTRKMENVLTLRIRVKLWRKIMHLPTSYYDEDNGNELVSRITTDASSPAALFSIAVICLTSVITVVQAFIRLYATNVALANYSLIMVPIIMLVFIGYSVLQFKLGVYSTRVTAGSLAYLAERVRSFRLMKSAVAEKIEAKLGGRTFKRMYIAEFLTWLSVTSFQIINSLTSVVFIVIVFVIGGQLIPAGVLTVGDLTGFYMITSVVGVQLGLFFINAGSLLETFGTMKKIAEVLDTPDERMDGKDVPSVCADLTFDCVNFAYSEEKDVLHDVSLTIPRGKVTAIVGGNGAGKSTLFKLLTRLYAPKSGTIRFAGEDISVFQLPQWRDRFAYVFQKAPLVSGTVRENIVYGLDREVTEDELIAVAKRANCYDCIMAKPGGFDEDVGLGGSNFSGGQAQCISIARAMLRDADILLLDEATSNLDVVSEAQVTDALVHLMQNRTTIMIAHSYAATRNADHVIVMDKGRVEAAGTPDELLTTNAYYQTFARTV